MSDLDLAAAVAAARRTADAVTGDATATRRRIRESLERRRGGRARRFAIVGVVAATLFGSTAFAYYRKPWRHEPTPVSAPRAPAIVIDPPEVVATPEVEAPHVEAPRVDASHGGASHIETTRVEAPHAVQSQRPAPRDPELATYQIAYDAHFHGSSPDAALAAWDTYLAAYPDGKLAIDARYNRAIILVKLKRYSDAADALRPLSSSRADAARLLNALPL